ncbi:hypothetical protein Palpr_0881 [Paludibacter propionicigenes WB4]|uniref:Uncharacterized protein n=1 Tax=Paludibacter propionicigenes (strain DSM 17365 / JCM 13257 / WB4) TaxID=694427 RepID=E4T2T8_PALPW|nr:hypothetical protein [Paludibacter propionicigenes]ADQ79032.1 hypothetical protein Palpr_0881 [Paludibacter propionicigenes WB4]
MNSKDYLKKKLNEISNVFPELTFRYQFNENTKTHIIEVKPLETYQTNNDYIKYEAELMFNFENEFFPETILFVSEDSLTQITEPEFTIQKQIFVSSPLKSNYLFELEKDLFCVATEINYALAA